MDIRNLLRESMLEASSIRTEIEAITYIASNIYNYSNNTLYIMNHSDISYNSLKTNYFEVQKIILRSIAP